MARPKLTEEEKEARKQAKLLEEQEEKENASKFSEFKIYELLEDDAVYKFIKKVKGIKGADEKQIFQALIDGFINGQIEFEQKTIITVKTK